MGTPLILDGLWRCLCPSVDATALSPVLRSGRTGAPASRPAAATAAAVVHRRQRPPLRPVHTQNGLVAHPLAAAQLAPHRHTTHPRRAALHGQAAATSPFAAHHGASPSPGGGSTAVYNSNTADPLGHVVDLLAARPPYLHELAAAPTVAIYAALRHLQDTRGGYDRIQAFVRYLLDERGERPSPALYEALVRANCHTTSGSADAVRDVLRALGANGGGGSGSGGNTSISTSTRTSTSGPAVEGTPSLYAGALAVLAVHPDYMLRNAVLQAMRARWIEPGPGGEQSLALGLLRDGQYERALDQLETMAGGSGDGGGGMARSVSGSSGSAGTAAGLASASTGAGGVPGWLYDIFTYVLAQKGFLDAALTIVNHRLLRADDAGDDGAAATADEGEGARRNRQPLAAQTAPWGAWGRSLAGGGSGPQKAAAAAAAASSAAGGGISPNLWYFLLDMCGRWGHYDGIVYVWRRAVVPAASPGLSEGSKAPTTPRLVTPSDAMALDVLNAAARHRDTALASEVLQLLTARGTKLGMPHFEAMIDCYAAAGAVDRALQALCIMHDAGLVPDAGCTRAIYQRLVQAVPPPPPPPPSSSSSSSSSSTDEGGGGVAAGPSAVEAAVATLADLRAQYGGGVPIAAFNVVLEAMLFGGAAAPDQGLDFYRQVRQLCPAGPNRATFQLLLRGCTDAAQLNVVAAEMRAFGMPLDAATVDRLVYKNARHGSLDAALQHLALLGGEGEDEGERPLEQSSGDSEDGSNAGRPRRLRPWISRRTAAALVQRCADEQDERIWAVAEAGRVRGRPLDALLRETLHLRTQPRAAEQA